MKSLLKYILICFAVGLSFAACKKDGSMIVAQNGASGTLSASTTTLVLAKATAADTVVKFNWTAPNFGYEAAITQTLQIAVAGQNFTDSQTVSLDPQQTYFAYSGLDFNTILGKMNLSFDEPTQIEVRVKSTISTSFPASYSNVVTMTVTPYAMTSWLYVPGAYQNWTITSPDSLVSMTGNGIYIGIINFPSSGSEFKLAPAMNWNTSYGDGGNGTLSTGGGNLASPGAGSYQITANLNTLTYTMAYFQWSAIGDATVGGWNTDTDMTYNNGDSTWSVTTTLVAGGLKFRKNHDWGTNYGGSGLSGATVSGGDNITITAPGTYYIKLDIPNQVYTITKK